MLDIVKGVRLDFSSIPCQASPPHPIRFKSDEEFLISQQLKQFLQRGIIRRARHEKGEFLSSIFARVKKSGNLRIILNLSKLNQFLVYEKFKMDSVSTIANMIRPNCYMASIDLKDAYYSIAVREVDRKFLRFEWEGELFEFCCLAQGLASAPRLFTKVLKPVYASLRARGFESSAYLDDSYLQADTYHECVLNVQCTQSLLLALGFVVNTEKSSLEPVQQLEHLGFILDSRAMTISLTRDRKDTIFQTASFVLHHYRHVKIRAVAKLIGLIVASEPAVDKCFLHYRGIEMDKIRALASNKGNFDAYLRLSDRAVSDLKWWITNVFSTSKPLVRCKVSCDLYTDASGEGWGAYSPTLGTAKGTWTTDDRGLHINILELRAALLGLQALCSDVPSQHICLHLDNTTAVAYIRNFGGTHSQLCNDVALAIWDWAEQKGVWLSATHIAGVDNTEADSLSRNRPIGPRNHLNISEWSLDPLVFQNLRVGFDLPNIDMFASQSNYKCATYVSWAPDPRAWRIDAFSFCWGDLYFYAFPPFTLLPRFLKKLEEDGATALLIAPCWPTAAWFPRLLKLLIRNPVELTRHQKLLHHHLFPDLVHPGVKSMRLTAWAISGIASVRKAFHSRLQKSSSRVGPPPPTTNTRSTWISGRAFVLNGALIPWIRM